MTTFFESADINVLGRFPGADVCGDTGSGVVGTNMYAYCDNSPVIFFDPDGTYKRELAVQYALRNYNSKLSLRYPYYRNGDCANFVSQCLYAGSIRMTSKWFCISWIARTASWTFVTDQMSYFSNKRYCQYKIDAVFYRKYNRRNTLVSDNELRKGIDFIIRNTKIGDILYLDVYVNGSVLYNHATIITKISAKDVFYSAHTSPRKNQSLLQMVKGGLIEACCVYHLWDNAS